MMLLEGEWQHLGQLTLNPMLPTMHPVWLRQHHGPR